MRSPDRSNVLVGVLSARMNIKQRDFQVSSTLERIAEPLELLAYLHHGPDGSPALRHAWRLLLETPPHDSICGCSVDQTHREMFPRYDRAEQLARQVARESVAHVIRNAEVPAGGGAAGFRPVPGALGGGAGGAGRGRGGRRVRARGGAAPAGRPPAGADGAPGGRLPRGGVEGG